MPKTASSIVQKLQKSSIRHTVSLPGSGPYTTSLASYWSKQEQELQPLCIIQPHSVLELAKAISLLTKSNTRFAIRGGGHQAWPGSANLEGGVTLDLRGLHEIEMVNGGNGGNEVRVGPGVWWGALYEFLSERRLTVPGGRALEPGVVGLMLGGECFSRAWFSHCICCFRRYPLVLTYNKRLALRPLRVSRHLSIRLQPRATGEEQSQANFSISHAI